MHSSLQKTVVCFGEVLWDVLPSGKIAGGAPMNVAFHLNNFGVRSFMLSKVGKDELGAVLMDFLATKGVNTDLVEIDENLPTGQVLVSLDEGGHASYEIIKPVAWDNIQTNNTIESIVASADAFVFGSLAARSEVSKASLNHLIDRARFKVFDVNLRAPFYSKELLESLLHKADFVKMNDEELDEIASWLTPSKNELIKLSTVRKTYGVSGILMTKGANGAVFFDDSGYYQQDGFPVKVQDTIGSGDSFLAAFLSNWLAGETIERCLTFACATGALVATKKGGTPDISENEVLTMINSGSDIYSS